MRTAPVVFGGNGIGAEAGRTDEHTGGRTPAYAVLSETKEPASNYGGGGGDLVHGTADTDGVPADFCKGLGTSLEHLADAAAAGWGFADGVTAAGRLCERTGAKAGGTGGGKVTGIGEAGGSAVAAGLRYL